MEIIFLLYFVSHIVITVLFDSQLVLPAWIYPTALLDMTVTYSKTFKDPFVLDPPAWYKSFVYCELLLQFPFFFVATYAFWKGKCRWIRIPAIIYGAHVATTLIPILFHTLATDFSSAEREQAGPVTTSELLWLCAIYMPYLIVPLLLIGHMLMSADYVPVSRSSLKQH